MLVLSKLGVPILPGKLIDLLRAYDVSFAIHEFFGMLRLDASALLDPDHREHDVQRASFSRFAEVYVASERAVRETALSFEPIIDTWMDSPNEGETLLLQLERAGIAWRTVCRLNAQWRETSGFRDAVVGRLQNWREVDGSEFRTIFVLAAEHGALTARFDAARAELLAFRIMLDEFEELGEDRALVDAAVLQADILDQRAQTGEMSGASAVEELEDILADVRLLGVVDPRAAELLEEQKNRRLSLEELGLNEHSDATEIKIQYRRLALRYHPDRNPDDAAAAKRMALINIAYEWLVEHELRNGQ